MKVALEAGEVLDVALIEGDRIIGTLSLQLKGLTATSRVGRPALSEARATGEGATPGRRRKPRKPLSAETKARMAEAQRRRWEAKRNAENNE